MTRLVAAALALCALVWTAPLHAHPHVYVDATIELVVDRDGRLVALKHRWTFDEIFSQYAKQGLDSNRDGRFSREELAPLAEVNVTSLQEFGYFTIVRTAAGDQPLGSPRDYWLDHDDATGQLALNYTLPLQAPVGGRGQQVRVLVYDREYFVAFEMAERDPVRVSGRMGCRTELTRPKELDDAQAAELAEIPPTVRNLPAPLQMLTQGLANDIALVCP